MERCPNCGNKLSNVDVLCPRCGTVVEVIQIKNNIASDATKSIAAADKKVEKKDFPQNFIVYNEDFPAEDESRDTHVAEAPALGETASFETPAGDVDPIAGQSILERYKQQQLESEPAAGENASAEAGGEDDNDYSSRYLENIMNINLPEIDDLQNFNPDEFMMEYRRSKSVSGEYISAPEKHWLEIEEAAPSDLGQESAVSAEPIIGRRYRGTSLRAKEPKEERQEGKAARPEKPKKMKPKKSSAMLSVLLWVLVTGALFFSFIFFDKYVQRAYGTYDNLIYSITNGKVELGPHS